MSAPESYRRPDVHDPTQTSGATKADALAIVLGPLRARTLRATARPITAGHLASRLHCAPNTVTYHCTQLESAGLIVRERRGPSVWISRTHRGEQLIEAFASRIIADGTVG
jgi:DNA-binding MarR family transcriptional regulator